MTQQVSPPYYVFITTGNVTKKYNHKIKIQLTQYQTYQLSMIFKRQQGFLAKRQLGLLVKRKKSLFPVTRPTLENETRPTMKNGPDPRLKKKINHKNPRKTLSLYPCFAVLRGNTIRYTNLALL